MAQYPVGARHRRADGSETMRIYVPVDFDLHEASVAMAHVQRELPHKIGRNTVRSGLQEYAHRYSSKGRPRHTNVSDEDRVFWRNKIVELGMFSDVDVAPGSSG